MMKKKVIALIVMSVLFSGCGSKAADTADDTAGKAAENVIAMNTGTAADKQDTEAMEVSGTDEEDTSGEDLTSQEDEGGSQPEEDLEDLSGRDLFADFIMGKGAASLSKDFVSEMSMTESWIKPGEEFTISELEEYFQKSDMIGNINPSEVAYAPLSAKGGSLFAMRLSYDAQMENITETMIFSDNGKELELLFAIDSWSRRNATVNKEGAVFDDGSNGAGSHSYVIYAPDNDLIYRKVSDLDEEYYGYDFYDEKGEPVEPLNTIMNEAGEGNSKAQDVAYYREVIDGRPYCYFLGGMGNLTQDTVEYIDKVAASHDFKFDGKQSADEARSAYEKQLGIEGISEDKTEPDWKTL